MRLRDDERKMLQGYHGEGVAIAMSVMVKLGQIYNAEEMIPISMAHIDGCVYTLGQAALDFAEKLADTGARVCVPTTLNMGARDITRWQEFRIPLDYAQGCQRMEQAYLKMGAIPTWTCTPYLQGIIPHFGEHIAWAESNAIAYANSVIGARTARYGDFADICAALTGRVPKFSLHLSSHRRGEMLFKLPPANRIDFNDDSLYPVIGYIVGSIALDRVPVIDGIPKNITADQLKAIGAAAASSGNVALFHIIGVTPEATTYEDAFQGKEPVDIIVIGEKELHETHTRLSTVEEGKADLVTIGCPHASFTEFEQLNRLLARRRIREGVEFWVTSNRVVYSWLEQTGLLESLKSSGIKVMTDSCILSGPYIEHWGFKLAVTNSAKFAHYAHKQINVIFGSLEKCVDAAIKGEVRKSET